VNGNVVNLASPVESVHAAGITVSGIPNPIRDATGIIAANLMTRGVDAHKLEQDGDFQLQFADGSLITPDVQILLTPYQINR
jgi:hypothetical protein